MLRFNWNLWDDKASNVCTIGIITSKKHERRKWHDNDWKIAILAASLECHGKWAGEFDIYGAVSKASRGSKNGMEWKMEHQ